MWDIQKNDQINTSHGTFLKTSYICQYFTKGLLKTTAEMAEAAISNITLPLM